MDVTGFFTDLSTHRAISTEQLNAHTGDKFDLQLKTKDGDSVRISFLGARDHSQVNKDQLHIGITGELSESESKQIEALVQAVAKNAQAFFDNAGSQANLVDLSKLDISKLKQIEFEQTEQGTVVAQSKFEWSQFKSQQRLDGEYTRLDGKTKEAHFFEINNLANLSFTAAPFSAAALNQRFAQIDAAVGLMDNNSFEQSRNQAAGNFFKQALSSFTQLASGLKQHQDGPLSSYELQKLQSASIQNHASYQKLDAKAQQSIDRLISQLPDFMAKMGSRMEGEEHKSQMSFEMQQKTSAAFDAEQEISLIRQSREFDLSYHSKSKNKEQHNKEQVDITVKDEAKISKQKAQLISQVYKEQAQIGYQQQSYDHGEAKQMELNYQRSNKLFIDQISQELVNKESLSGKGSTQMELKLSQLVKRLFGE